MIKMEYRLFCVVCIVGIRYTIKLKKSGGRFMNLEKIYGLRSWSKELLLKNLKLERNFRIFMKIE